jgi:hypothetical protein
MKCEWVEEANGFEGMGVWATECGHAFEITDGWPSNNEMKYCCYCGKKLDEKPFVWEVWEGEE